MSIRAWSAAILLAAGLGSGALGDELLEELFEGTGSALAEQAGLELPEIPRPEHPGPGYTERIVAFSDRGVSYKLFLPSAYEHDPDRRFPSVIKQHPGGRPDIVRYQEWAEAREVILVGIEKVSNGMLQHDKPRHWRGVMRDLEERSVRVHPHLRFTIGMSGGAADGERFSRIFPRQTAGVVLMGVGGFGFSEARSHILLALMGGAKDSWIQPAGVDRIRAGTAEHGQPLRVIYEPDRAHTTAPMEEQFLILDWMLTLAPLVNRYLSDEERAAHLESSRQAMGALGEIGDPGRRRTEAERFLMCPPLAALSEAATARTLWRDAVLAQAQGEEDPAARHAFLREARDGEIGAHLTDEEAGPLDRRIADLAARPDVARDWASRVAWHAARELETQAGLDRDAIRAADAAYGEVVDAHPNTHGAAQAARARARLARFL